MASKAQVKPDSDHYHRNLKEQNKIKNQVAAKELDDVLCDKLHIKFYLGAPSNSIPRPCILQETIPSLSCSETRK